jgi:hypothetical protein
MKKLIHKKRLELRREQIRDLDTLQLREVVGGTVVSDTCQVHSRTGYCSDGGACRTM